MFVSKHIHICFIIIIIFYNTLVQIPAFSVTTADVKSSVLDAHWILWPNCRNTAQVLHNNPPLQPESGSAFGGLDPDHSCECDITLFHAWLPAAVEIKQLIVSHARMQSRPSDSREQKVGRRHVSGGGSGGAFVRRQWQKGGWRGLARRYSETICKAGCWSQAKDSRTAGALAWLINVGLTRTSFWYEWRQRRDNILWVFNITVIKWQQWTNAVSSAGDTQCQKGGQHLLVINIFTTKTTFWKQICHRD